ncbi:MAG: hypothetical protein K2P48_00070 [Lachnospiraceae bacterium]|nr:hypothetical protein [Lachnospiraceae bacterium]
MHNFINKRYGYCEMGWFYDSLIVKKAYGFLNMDGCAARREADRARAGTMEAKGLTT